MAYQHFDVGFELKIESGNLAFQADACGEISRIICDIAGQIENGRSHGRCRDINGNDVGIWALNVEQSTVREAGDDDEGEAA